MDAVIVCIGEDFEANLLTSVLLKQMGVKRVITRASNPVHKKILELVGVDRIISPEDEMGVRLANSLINIKALDYISLSDDYAVVQIRAPKKFIGKTVGDVGLRSNYNVNLIAIKKESISVDKNGEQVIEYTTNDMPNANTVFEQDDILVLLGDNESIQVLTLMAADERKTSGLE
jgi:trk system potassium uptake protein TrkA